MFVSYLISKKVFLLLLLLFLVLNSLVKRLLSIDINHFTQVFLDFRESKRKKKKKSRLVIASVLFLCFFNAFLCVHSHVNWFWFTNKNILFIYFQFKIILVVMPVVITNDFLCFVVFIIEIKTIGIKCAHNINCGKHC